MHTAGWLTGEGSGAALGPGRAARNSACLPCTSTHPHVHASCVHTLYAHASHAYTRTHMHHTHTHARTCDANTRVEVQTWRHRSSFQSPSPNPEPTAPRKTCPVASSFCAPSTLGAQLALHSGIQSSFFSECPLTPSLPLPRAFLHTLRGAATGHTSPGNPGPGACEEKTAFKVTI